MENNECNIGALIISLHAAVIRSVGGSIHALYYLHGWLHNSCS